MRVRKSSGIALFLYVSVGGCGGGGEDSAGLARRLNEASEKFSSCQQEQGKLRDDLGALKRQLAEAMANPGRVHLTDPEVIELVAKVKADRLAAAPGGRSPKAGKESEDVKWGKGDLDPRAASKIILGGAQAMQICYERALKKNATLQYQAGITLTVGVTVKPSGSVNEVDIAPSPDRDMIACMKSSASHWKFPAFGGQSVTVEQRFTLTPKS